jgi:hypothetical protein
VINVRNDGDVADLFHEQSCGEPERRGICPA